jgi:hypothetical protein
MALIHNDVSPKPIFWGIPWRERVVAQQLPQFWPPFTQIDVRFAIHAGRLYPAALLYVSRYVSVTAADLTAAT